MNIGDIFTFYDGMGNAFQQQIIEVDKDENGLIIGWTAVDIITE
jgi:hypothetical protein